MGKFYYELSDVSLKSLRKRMLEARIKKHKPVGEIRNILGKETHYSKNSREYNVLYCEDKYAVTMCINN